MLNALRNKLNPETNAIDLLKSDHREVEALFKAFENAGNGRTRQSIVGKICAALDAHTKIEEKIFYPTVKKELKKLAPTINEGIIEHTGAKKLIRELKAMSSTDEYFEPKVKVLKEYITHHVKEEESQMFPKVEDSELDLVALAERMQTLKEQTLKAAA